MQSFTYGRGEIVCMAGSADWRWFAKERAAKLVLHRYAEGIDTVGRGTFVVVI